MVFIVEKLNCEKMKNYIQNTFNKCTFSTYSRCKKVFYSNQSYILSYIPNNTLFLTSYQSRPFSTNKEKINSKEGIELTQVTGSSKTKNLKIWIDFNVFNTLDLDKFASEIYYSNKLKPEEDYSIIIKLKKNELYFSIADKQKHFKFNKLEDYAFEKLFCFIRDKLDSIFKEYNSLLDYHCDSILLEFRTVNVDKKIKISNSDKVKSEHKNLDVANINKDLDFYGEKFKDVIGSPLNATIVDNKLQISNTFAIDNLDRFLDEYNKKMTIEKIYDYLVKDSTKFYLVNRNKRSFIISVNISEDGKMIDKKCFNIHGDIISKVKDILNTDGSFTRKSRNSSVVYTNNSITSLTRDIKFNSIKSEYESTKTNQKDWLPNPYIGTLDLETFEMDGETKCYAIGFYCNTVKECNTYYIDKDLDSTKLIHNCISEMLKPKYNNNIFYVHNLARFDVPFIIKALSDFNKTYEGKSNPYILDASTRDKQILRLIIKRRVNDRIQSVKLQDSVAILPNDLRSLCKDYEVEEEKGLFPYSFCNKYTLFYIGKTPDISYYDNISQKDYDLLYKEVWSLKDECLLYLNKDLISLCQVLNKANKTMHYLLNIQMTDCLTITGISMRYFLKDHYLNKEEQSIPLVTNKAIWDDIYQAYYGGRVEVYNPTFKINKRAKNSKKLYYLDVNSLYPFASLNRMPGLNCQYIESYKQPLDLDQLFGFFYCKIKSNNGYLGLLPKRTEKGNLIFPTGKWSGWYFSEALKYAKEKGYKVEPFKGYNFNSVDNVFTSFVLKVIDLKINAKNRSERNVAKLILNSLIGRFGMNFLKTVTRLFNSNTHDLISVTRAIKNSIEIDEDLYLDSFTPGVDKEVCESFGVDMIKVLNTESVDEKSSSGRFKTVSIPIAAATLSYARIHMAKLMSYILENNGKIYYTDTDSIVTDYKLPDNMIHSTELGKLKLEHEIVEGYFISDKTYAFVTTEGKLVKRAKGVDSEYLTLDDYKNMYNLKSVKNVVKKVSNRDYQKGSVTITTKNNVNLNIEHYNKRTRIFNNNKKWIGTKPLYINEE